MLSTGSSMILNWGKTMKWQAKRKKVKTNKNLKKFQPSEGHDCKKAYHKKDKKPQTDPLKICRVFDQIICETFEVQL